MRPFVVYPLAAAAPLVGWAAVSFPHLFGGPLVVLVGGLFVALAGLFLPRRLDLIVIAWWFVAVAALAPWQMLPAAVFQGIPGLPDRWVWWAWAGLAVVWWTVAFADAILAALPRPGMKGDASNHRPRKKRRIRGPGPVCDLSRLPVATTAEGESWSIPFQGGHVLVVGESGAGKGSVEWSIVEQLTPHIRDGLVRVVAIDPKTMELGRARQMWDVWVNGMEDGWQSRAAAVLEAEVQAMNRRCSSMLDRYADKHTPTVDEPLTVVLIDELLRVTRTVTDGDVRRRIQNALMDLLSNGRAPGWVVVACTQEPAQSVVGPVRDLFPVRVCLRVASAVDVDMTLGSEARTQHGADAHQIKPHTEQGVGYVWSEDRQVERVRFNYLDTPAIRALVDAPRSGPDPVETAEPGSLADLVEVAWTDGEDVMHMDELAAATGRSQGELKATLVEAGLPVLPKVKKKRGDTWTPKNGVRRRDFDAWREGHPSRNRVSTA